MFGLFKTTPDVLRDGTRAELRVNSRAEMIAQSGGHGDVVKAKFTRPATTTTYAAGEVVNDSVTNPSVLTFKDMGRFDGGTGLIARATLIKGASETLKPDLELWLFSKAPVPDMDNAAFTPTTLELQSLVDIFQFPTGEFFVGTVSTNSVCRSVQENVIYKCEPGDRDLYGVFVVRNAFVPVASGQWQAQMQILQD